MTAWSLIAISVLCGIATAWVFRHTTDLAALSITRRQLVAHLLEFRLFYDEPRLIWRAQIAVIRDNLRLLRLMLAPLAILAIPMMLIYVKLDSVYGFRPLRAGESTVFTAHMDQPLSENAALETPAGIIVETPPVRIAIDHEIAWRIRAVNGVSKNVRVTLAGRVLDVDYPSTDVGIVGISLPWLAWFFLFSSASALCAITLRW